MFNIEGIHKEMFPYNYYTMERLNKGAIGIINESGENEKQKWNESDYKIFNENIDSITQNLFLRNGSSEIGCKNQFVRAIAENCDSEEN